MSYRKEKKYRLTNSDFHSFRANLFTYGMTELFEGRIVNSLYFDTERLSMFFDSEEGVLPRKKIRFRWYDNEKKISKETKISSVEGRFKTTESMSNFTDVQDHLTKRLFDDLYGPIKPSLFVTYYREYYMLNDLRITFDTNITYGSPRSQVFLQKIDNENVSEVKVPIDCDDDYIEGIISQATARFSKYSRGLLTFGNSPGI